MELEIEAIDALTRKLHIGRAYALASSILLFYDHALTLRREISLIWHRLTITTGILLFLRYYTMLAYLVMLVALFDMSWSDEMCDRYLIFPKIYMVLCSACSTLILGMRIHAIYNNRIIDGFVAAAWMVVNVLSIIAWSKGHRYDGITPAPIRVGCMLRVQGKFKESPLARFWISRCAFDLLVIILTVSRTAYMQGCSFSFKVPIARVLTRDGVMYFIIIALAELTSLNLFGSAVTVNHILSNTLIVSALSRLVFNLREEVYPKSLPTSLYTAPTFNTLAFDTHLGAADTNILTNTQYTGTQEQTILIELDERTPQSPSQP